MFILKINLFCLSINRLFQERQFCSGFGGLEVACWPLVPKFTGSNPAEAVGFFRAEKSSAHLPSERLSFPCRRFTTCKRFLNATWKSGISGKIHRPFLAHIVQPLATRISGETSSSETAVAKKFNVCDSEVEYGYVLPTFLVPVSHAFL